jgi:hypothetical protein
MIGITVARIARRGDGYRCDVELAVGAGEVIMIPNVAAHPRSRRSGWFVSMPHEIVLSRGLRDRVTSAAGGAIEEFESRHADAA